MSTAHATSAATTIMAPEAIIDFGTRWYLYGGGPAEDIMVTFGWSPTRYFTELQQLLRTNPPEHLSQSTVEAMLEVCRGRIWIGQ